MTSDAPDPHDPDRPVLPGGPPAAPGPDHRTLPDHPVRTALLGLLREDGTVTSTEAARRLGHSSGVCSFHLRRLAGAGLVEEVPHARGRSRPWRLVPAAAGPAGGPQPALPGEEFGALARGLEDESWRRRQETRADAPPEWRRDEAFSAVIYLAPDELAEVADAVRAVLDKYRDREWRPSARPPGAGPVAAMARLFPLLPENGGSSAPETPNSPKGKSG